MKKNLVIILIIFLFFVLFRKSTNDRSANTGNNGNSGGTGGGGSSTGGGTDPDPEPVDPEPENLAFTAFELNTLPALVAGTNDISAKNTLGFEVFPDTNGQPRSNFVPLNIWGDGVEFLNRSGDTKPIALQKGLATGFDNAALNSILGVPSEHRYKWTLYNEWAFWQQSHAQLKIRGGQEYHAVKSQSVDSNKVQVPFKYSMLDIEGGVEDFSKISAFLEGYYNAAKADNPSHVIIFYGYMPNQGFAYWHNGYSYQGDNVPLAEKFFPFSKPSWNQSHVKKSSGVITSFSRGKDILYNVSVSYPKVNLPLTSSMYQKSGGNFVLDNYGQRVFRNDYFEETQRGELIRWSAAGQQSQITADEQHNYGAWRLMPEVYFAAHQFAGLYSDLFFRLQMLANECGLGDDFQNLHSIANPYKTIGILRPDFESNPFTNAFRPLDRVTAEWFSSMIFTKLNNLAMWTGITGGNVGLTKSGAYLGGNFIQDLHKSVNEGQPFLQPYFGEGGGQLKYTGHLGAYRQFAAKYSQMQSENRVHNLWQKSDKICAFAHPEKFINGHSPAVGRLQGNYLKLHAVEARLDVGESFNVTVKTTKNSFAVTKTIQAKKVLNEVIALPAGTYNAQDIYLEYNNPVKAGLHRVNGRGETI